MDDLPPPSGRGNLDRLDGPYQLGRYVVLRPLGRGGMGTVLEAFDPTLDRRVAIKLLHEAIDEGHAARLLREAQAMAKISHPHVVQVFEAGTVDGETYVAMELLRGKTLAEWMRATPRPSWEQCLEVFVQAGEGLAGAHARGLVHRDFKPSNAIVDDEGRVRVLDFGLARRVDVDELADATPASASTLDGADPSLTRSGAILGTPAYMPLEQMRGADADERSDQFSFCVSLYEALHGERPYAGSSVVALMVSVSSGVVSPSPKGSTVPAALRRILLRGLAADPSERWPTMEALLDQLRGLVQPRRRSRAVGAVMVVGVLAVGGGLGVGAAMDRARLCSGAEDQLQGVWDDERRQAAEQGVLATELPLAVSTWPRVQQGLDEYADAWVREHVAACEATRKTGDQSEDELGLRMGCLRARRASLDATIRVLAEADDEVVVGAIESVEALPAIERCGELEWLERREQRVPPPEDPHVANEVEAVREQLTHARVLRSAGAYADARGLLDAALEQVRGVEHPPVRAEAELEHGRLLAEEGRLEDSERALERAHALAAAHDHEEVEVEAATELALVVGVRLTRHVEGLLWGRVATPVAERLEDPQILARCIDVVAGVLTSQGEYAEAKVQYERGLELRRRELGEHHLDVAMSLNGLGKLFGLQGDYARSESMHRRAVEITTAVLGPEHPRIAVLTTNLGVVLDQQGDYERSEAEHRRALRIAIDALGEEHPEVAAVRNNLGTVLRRQGKADQAEAEHRLALSIRERALGPEHLEVADSLINLGVLHFFAGRHDQAELRFRRALSIRERMLGAEHALVGQSTNNLGLVLKSMGRLEEAEGMLRRALAINEEALGSDHAEIANGLNNLGVLMQQREDFEEAARLHRRALSIHEEALGPEHPTTAESMINLGLTLWHAEELEEASAVLRRARSSIERSLGPEHALMTYCHLGLAEVALERGELDEALLHARRIVALRERDGAAPELLAEARFLLARVLWSRHDDRVRARALAEDARAAYAEAGPGEASYLATVEAWLLEHGEAPAPGDERPR